MSSTLSRAERLALKKQAHHLKPVVQTGAAGLSEAVLAEIDRALTDHELIKLKLAVDDKRELAEQVGEICDRLAAAEIQRIGRTATIYRPRPEDDA